MRLQLKLMAKKLLEQCERGWTIQGLGMMRLYLSRDTRLHVWDSRYAVPNVSQMHTHPWHFNSLVIAGEVRNQRFVEGNGGDSSLYYRQKLHCGEGGGLIGEPSIIQLCTPSGNETVEVYREGDTYYQKANEIHVSNPLDGTVTLVTRSVAGNPDHAYVYWRNGDNWVSAEPRPALPGEIADITSKALSTWF